MLFFATACCFCGIWYISNVFISPCITFLYNLVLPCNINNMLGWFSTNNALLASEWFFFLSYQYSSYLSTFCLILKYICAFLSIRVY